jgi:membrane-bound metal-dependent hydrolase YbcI (DUF457 family)
MPTPFGHSLAGATIAWCAESIRRTPLDSRDRLRLTLACAGLAVAPDLDFLYPPIHRTMTHSLSALGLVVVATGLIAWRVRRNDVWYTAVACAFAYASHLGLDWLGSDTKLPAGIQLFWPFSNTWFISSLGVFRATDLRGFFRLRVIVSNALAVLRELLILTPISLCAWWLRNRRIRRPACGD